MAVISTLILTLAAVFVFGYRMSGNVFMYISLWLLTMLSMFSIGLMVASLCRTTKSMNVVTSRIYFPMLFFSGATGINLLKSVSVGCYDNMTVPVVTLVAITVICSIVSVKSFRWE